MISWGMTNRLPRIGRDRTPAGRSLANARENPEAAERHGRSLFLSEGGKGWASLTPLQRSKWIDTALEMMVAHAQTHPNPPLSDPPGGGERLPLTEVA